MYISGGQNIRMAISAVWTHRFRSLLTILGIVIGITTVVTVASLLTGLRKGVVTFFQQLGPDNIFVYKTSGDPNGRGLEKERKRRPIKPEYADLIKRWCTSVEDTGIELFIPPVVDDRPLTARVPGYESDNVSLVGDSPNMMALSPRDLDAGRSFTAEENARALRVAVVGAIFAKAKGGFFGENGLDNQIVIPLRTAQIRYPQVDRFMIVAQARPGQRKNAYDEVEAALRRMRHVPRGAENDFSLSTPDQIIQQFDRITGLIGLVAIAISGLGLLAGGIGVMNIMLVSVTERTREIGVRKAVGARSRDIVGQFLVEAMTLTGAGGVLGIIVAVLITLLIGKLVPSLPSQVPSWALVTGFTVSVAIGLFFGVWPAVKAARLDPVEALRYE